DHDVRDVNAVRSELACHALRDHSQARFRGRELREARPAAHASRGAGEDHRATAERDQPARRLAADEESGEAVLPPGLLELRGGELAEVEWDVEARRVEHDGVHRLS